MDMFSQSRYMSTISLLIMICFLNKGICSSKLNFGLLNTVFKFIIDAIHFVCKCQNSLCLLNHFSMPLQHLFRKQHFVSPNVLDLEFWISLAYYKMLLIFLPDRVLFVFNLYYMHEHQNLAKETLEPKGNSACMMSWMDLVDSYLPIIISLYIFCVHGLCHLFHYISVV